MGRGGPVTYVGFMLGGICACILVGEDGRWFFHSDGQGHVPCVRNPAHDKGMRKEA